MQREQEYWGMPAKTYCMLIHLSLLSNIVAPGLGFILPIVMWAVNKDNNTDIDRHGKVTINWIISFVIYSAICGVLTLVFIGVIGFAILAFLNFLFAIIAALKANDGELWKYPFSIEFLKP